MQLREASSVYRNEIVDNRPGDLGRTSYHAEKDGLQGRFDIQHSWEKVGSTLGV